jgi:hypothetical protein
MGLRPRSTRLIRMPDSGERDTRDIVTRAGNSNYDASKRMLDEERLKCRRDHMRKHGNLSVGIRS